jgi:hypothetical protein
MNNKGKWFDDFASNSFAFLSLMEMLEKAITHTEAIESRLNQYDDMLEHIRDSMDKMEGKTMSIETMNHNNKKLLDTLEKVLQQLDLPYKYQVAIILTIHNTACINALSFVRMRCKKQISATRKN